MKKALPILLIIGVLGLVLQVAVNVFIVEKDSNYAIKTKDNHYNIEEHLEVIDNVSYYNIAITDKDNQVYTIFLEEDFNKQTEVVRDIRTFKSNNLNCIFPVFRRDVTGSVTCLYNGETVSYNYLKQIGNQDVKAIIEQLKNEKFKHKSWEEKTSSMEKLFAAGRGIDVYKDNILKGYTFLIWRYKGLYILKSDELLIKDYLEKDVYDNSLSAIVGRYYVTADKRTDTFRVSELVYYNTKELGRGKIVLPDATSSDIYFNGVVGNVLYMTDVGYKKQFVINPATEKVTEVGNVDKGFITFVDGEKKEVTANEFLTTRVYFNNANVQNEVISKKYGTDVQIKKDGAFYYFKCSNGKFYRAHINSPEHAEVLFMFNNITDWKVKNGDILLAAGDMIYFYNEDEGILPIANNKELLYNYNNIIDFWKK